MRRRFFRDRRGRASLSLFLPIVPLLLGAAAPDARLFATILDAQNRERGAMGLAPLRWNAGLARDAQLWADHLAATDSFDHAPPEIAGGQGENLWEGSRGRFSAQEMVQGWIEEKRLFKPGTFPDNSLTASWHDVGHYTQIVWRDTREVGCAIASDHERDILVCRYARPGNVIGRRPF